MVDRARVKAKQRSRLLQLTLPTVLTVLRGHVAVVLSAIAVSFLLSFVPVLTTDLEAAIVEQISAILRGELQRPESLPGALSDDALRFSSATTEDAATFPQNIAGALLGVFVNTQPRLWMVLASYALIAIVASGLNVLSGALRAVVTSALFEQLWRDGAQKALCAEPVSQPSLKGELAGRPSLGGEAARQAVALRAGAGSVAQRYSGWLEVFQIGLSLVTALVAVAAIDWRLMSGFITFVVAQILLSRVRARRMQASRQDFDERRNHLDARSEEILDKQEIILAHERQKHYGDVLAHEAHTYAQLDRELYRREQRYFGVSRFLEDLGRIGVLLLALWIFIIDTDASIGAAGDAYFILALYSRLLGPATNLLSHYDDWKRSEDLSRSFLKILATQVAEPEQDQGTGLEGEDMVRFEDVHFSYRDEEEAVLAGVTFRVPRGRTTLLLGPSGSGKTTIARMMLGFLHPQCGTVLVDGRGDLSPLALRGRMSYISQRDHIVEDPVEANFFSNDVSGERMLATLRDLGIDRVGRPVTLDKPAKELSTGQQQRLALARMLVDTEPLVIMDEPLSGVDVFTFQDLQPVLSRFLRSRDRTILLISHRLSLASYADHIVVLSAAGTVEEEGTKEKLIATGGRYAALRAAAIKELSA